MAWEFHQNRSDKVLQHSLFVRQTPMVILLTCYFRHIKDLLNETGVEVTPQNKREIDRLIHELVGVDYKDCPATWKEVKKRMTEDRVAFVTSLRAAMSGLAA